MNKFIREILDYELGSNSCSYKQFILDILIPSSSSFIRALRLYEGIKKRHGLLFILVEIYYKRISCLTGLTVPPYTCERGLTLYHYGSIVINPAAKIGKNCCIMNNVNIGANGGSDKAPTIGNDVYIGPGAVLFGDIEIADGCYIGANAVVNRSFTQKNSIIAGIPAKIIKTDTEVWWKKNKLERD